MYSKVYTEEPPEGEEEHHQSPQHEQPPSQFAEDYYHHHHHHHRDSNRFQLQLKWSFFVGILFGVLFLLRDPISEAWRGQQQHNESSNDSLVPNPSPSSSSGHDVSPNNQQYDDDVTTTHDSGSTNTATHREYDDDVAPHHGTTSTTTSTGNATKGGTTDPKNVTEQQDSSPTQVPPSKDTATPATTGGGSSTTGGGVDETKKTTKEDDETVQLLDFPTGYKPHPNLYSESYLPRGKPIDDKTRQALTSKWGSWTFVDPKNPKSRPNNDYYSSYPSRDIPQTQFPTNAWQTDHEYLKQFVPQAQALVQRAMEAILTEYGHGVEHEPTKTIEERAEMFSVQFSNDTSGSMYMSNPKDAGGFMNYKGWDGLQRRILHAILTQDTFRVVMGGHSAAAGHGNHFQQSYTLQIQRILEPIFARLGVTMTAHNIGMGGLGTLQNVLGAHDLYSDDVDVLVYDSGMTEVEGEVMDLFMRQGILSGNKVPLLWVNQDIGRFFKADIFTYLGQECDADVAVFGTGMRGIPHIMTAEEATKLPWATQYLSCDGAISQLCKEHEYMSLCWVERDDVTPPTKQGEFVGSRAGWHPGNRFHQLQGRVLAFVILNATATALEKWSQADNMVLEDSEWHVHEYYNNIRTKLLNLNHTTYCHENDKFPSRVCTLPLHARGEFTPRLNPFATSIRSIMKAGNISSQLIPNIYDPPDVRNPNLDECDVDVVNIVENGVEFAPLLGRTRRRIQRQEHLTKSRVALSQSASSFNPEITPGLGWDLVTKSAPDNCDGSYDSFCGRSPTEPCLMSGHNDFRGGLGFDSLSGWLILNLEQVQHGLIILKIEDWIYDLNKQTTGWTCENNSCPRRLRSSVSFGVGNHNNNDNAETVVEDASSESTLSLQHPREERVLKPTVPDYCDDFQFQFALDGKITTWNREEWQKREQHAQRVVQLWTLLDDPNFITDSKPKDVELAIRMQGCGRTKIFHLTHVYWA